MPSQAIKYQTTSVEATQSAQEIQQIVQKYGASRCELRWDDWGRVSAVRFALRHDRMGEIPVSLEARTETIEEILRKDDPYTRRKQRSKEQFYQDQREQAHRIAWRQLKDFIEQSLLAVKTGLFPIHEAFMAHIETPDPATGELTTFGRLMESYGAVEPGRGVRLLTEGAPPVLEADWEEVDHGS